MMAACAMGGDGDLKELFYRQQGAFPRGRGRGAPDLIKTSTGTFTAKLLGDITRATLDDGSNVPRIPPYRIGGGLGWQGQRLDAGVTVNYWQADPLRRV
jgi:iron complex outermembrane receptor protein